jgi:hypothetical protein
MLCFTNNFDHWRRLIGTTGLKGLWVLEQLDRTGIASLKMLILLSLAGSVVGLLLSLSFGPVAPDSVFASYYDERVTRLTMLVMCGTIGLTLAFDMMLARTTEADLRLLSRAANFEASPDLLKPKWYVFMPVIAAITLFTSLASPILAAQRLDITVMEAVQAFYDGGMPLRIVTFVLWPIAGIVWGAGFAIGVTQIVSLIKAARTIPIDLFQLTHYEALTNPTIRVIIISLVMSSIFPMFMFLTDDPAVNEQLTKLLIGALLIVMPALAAWCYPVFILRNRIRLKKTQELDCLLLAILGDDVALGKSCIPKRGNEITTADLLVHQMFIESRWEWPIASHVQKLIVFGLLPPLTWVFAAMIENLLY